MGDKQKNTNYIFTFGNVGVGKSTIMSVIAKILIEKAAVYTNPENRMGNLILVSQWIQSLNMNKFPPRSRVGDIFEIDMGAEFIDDDGEILKLTFLEMSGEDFQMLDIRNENGQTLEEKFSSYAQVAKIFLVVTDYKKAAYDDILIWQFFNHLVHCEADLSNVILVVSKWDLCNNENFSEFVQQNMPQTSQWLKSGNMEKPKALPFTIGELDDGNIIQLNLTDGERIIKWIYQILKN